MKVRYLGPIDAVVIAEVGVEAEREGAPVTVPNELGARLCEQECWEEVKSDKAPKRSDS